MSPRPSMRPGKIGKMNLANRIVYPPMVSNFCEASGGVSERYIAYMRARALGGCGLLITEAAMISPDGRSFPNQLGIQDDKMLPGLRKLTDAIHDAGSKIAVQLFYPGRQTSRAICGATPKSPSPVVFNGEMTEQLDDDDIGAIIKSYGEAAARAREAGFDAVEIHGGNGYILQQFHSRFTNHRKDKWGGYLGHRTRFSREVIREARLKASGDFPLILRLGVFEDMQNGLTKNEGLAIAELLAMEEIDALDITAGMRECGYLVTPPASLPVATHMGLARMVKEKISHIPVIGMGRILDLDEADRAIERGDSDFVIMGRAQIADPEVVKKDKEGKKDYITPCLSCNEGCMNNIANGRPMACAVNPLVGREGECAPPVEKPLKIVVVGAGPAGCAAAVGASSRGHKVVLMEKEPKAGGKLGVAALPPFKERLAVYAGYLERLAQTAPLEYCPGMSANVENIMAHKPDRVIIAIGAEPAAPPVPGIDAVSCIHAERALAMDPRQIAEDVLILGGGMVGAECAEKLARAGKNVTIVEVRPEIAGDVEPRTRILLRKRLESLGVDSLVSCKIKALKPREIVLEKDGKTIRMPFSGTMVSALGYSARHGLARELREKGVSVLEAGDGKNPRNILEAVLEGHLCGCAGNS